MKPIYQYPEFFIHKMGDLYWSTGHPASPKWTEERWRPLGRRAEKRVRADQLNENKPMLTLHCEFGEIDYLRTGVSGKPVLLLIPGFPDCWFTFHKIIPILAKQFDVISYSPPGHGYSTFTTAFDFSIDSYCKVIQMIFQKLQLKKVILIGHSVGGEQALRTSLQMKALSIVQGLILINAWGPSVFPRKTMWDFSEDISTWPIVGTELVRIFGGKLGGMQEMFKKVFFRPADRPHIQNLRNELSKPFLDGTAFQLFINKKTANAIVEMQKEQKRINENVKEYFQNTRKKFGYPAKIPTLVIGTAHDKIFPYSYARGLYRAIQTYNPNTHFKKIKQSGHMPTLETPKRTAYHISSFIHERIEH